MSKSFPPDPRILGYGRVGRKPELKETKAKSPYLSLAIKLEPKNSEPIWISTTIFGSEAKNLADTLGVGDMVFIDGLITLSQSESGAKFFNLKPNLIQKISDMREVADKVDEAFPSPNGGDK